MGRLSAGTLLAGILAVLFGLLGAYVVRKQFNRPIAPPPRIETPVARGVTVPVAAADLPAGRKLTLGDIVLLRLSAEQAQAQGLDKRMYMSNSQQIIGRTLKGDLRRGATFDPGLFYPEGIGPNVADKLKPGFRAVTIAVEANSAVAGFASPGTMVDVLFRAQADKNEDLPETTITLIDGVEVLALNTETMQGTRGENGRRNNNPKYAVTVAVTPQQAAALRVVEGRGELSLALRGPDDEDRLAANAPKTLDELLDRSNRRYRIEVYRGRAMSQVDFRRNERVGGGTGFAPPVAAGVKPNPVPPVAASDATPDAATSSPPVTPRGGPTGPLPNPQN